MDSNQLDQDDIADTSAVETTRKRKSVSKFDGDYVVNDKEIKKLSYIHDKVSRQQSALKIKEQKKRLKLEENAAAITAAAIAEAQATNRAAGYRKRSKIILPLPAVIKPLTNKQKEENEREDRLMADYQHRLVKVSSYNPQPLPQGPWIVKDLSEAIQCGTTQSQCLLLDWTTPEVKRIGRLCKIYWDGENEWFYARVLYYDRIQKLHLVSRLKGSACTHVSVLSIL